MSRTFFAYHLTHFFGPFSVGSYHTNSGGPSEGDLLYVVSGDNAEDGGKDYFLEGFFRVFRRANGPFLLKSLSGEPRQFEYRLSLEPVRVPPQPIAMRRARWYDREEVHRYFSSGQNFNPVKPNYKIRFDELLIEFAINDEMAADLAYIDGRSDITPRQREVLSQARVGQGKFRRDVAALSGRGEICAVTKIDVPELLVASHIKPWRDSSDEERLDPCNGLLLVAHIDRAFDRYLLSFREERSGGYVISIHARLLKAFRSSGVTSSQRLSVSHMNLSDSQRFNAYMAEHFRKHSEILLRDKSS